MWLSGMCWRRLREARKAVKSGEVVNVEAAQGILFEELDDVVEEEDEKETRRVEERGGDVEFMVHVPLPDDKEVERMVVERKKQELLSNYACDDLLKEQNEAEALLNIQS